MPEDVEILKALTGCTDESLLEILLEDAKETVLSYTNRKNLIPQLRKPMRDLALIAYNRRGTEGKRAGVRVGSLIVLMMHQNRFMTS